MVACSGEVEVDVVGDGEGKVELCLGEGYEWAAPCGDVRLDRADGVLRGPAERQERVQVKGREHVAQAGCSEVRHLVADPPARAAHPVAGRKDAETAQSGSTPSAYSSWTG